LLQFRQTSAGKPSNSSVENAGTTASGKCVESRTGGNMLLLLQCPKFFPCSLQTLRSGSTG